MEIKPKLLVLYATQTGNAQDVAERVGREAERLQLSPIVRSIDAIDLGKLASEKIVVFIVSTTGQGDPPDTMKSFWKLLLRRSLTSDWLKNLNYAVFGLGDSGYVQYNVVAKKLDRRLSDLGGHQIIERGLGDDQHPSGYEASLDPWLISLWKALENITGWPLDFSNLSKSALTLDSPKYSVISFSAPSEMSARESESLESMKRAVSMMEAADATHECKEPLDMSVFGQRNPYLARMICNKRLTKDYSERDVRHIGFDLGNSGMTYKPGDALAIMPSQSEHAVDTFLSRCSLDPDDLVLVQAAHKYDDSQHKDSNMTTPVTIRTLVKAVLDVASASPRRYFFEVMSHFATAEHEKDKLIYFGSPEGRDELYQYNQRERRSVLEVLEDFPSVKLPFEWLLQLVPRLQPRLFSISSSLSVHPKQVHITVAVQKWMTPMKRTRHGLCSTWLSHLDPHNARVLVPVWIKGGLRFPDVSVPLILVGPGTGCAPFRALVEERISMSMTSVVTPIMFFFGCRHEDDDFLYKEFWLAQTQGSGVFSEEKGGGFYVAFSRDQAKKVYVQHKIEEQSEKVWTMLNAGCAVYIAGSAVKMPSDVFSALERVVMQKGGMSEEAARRWLKQLERVGRYHVEAW